MNKTVRNLILLFTGILAIKTVISFFMSGTYFYSDEACIIIKAKHFAENFQLATCNEAAKAPGGDPHPFFSILISPIFIIFKGFNAYLAVLVFNSILISSLVFPLYGFIKNFIKKDLIIFLIITTILFLPQVTIYEKTVLSETSFVFLNIWLLYFYAQYKTLKKKNLKYLILTIIFAIFAGLSRPFGFIVAIALTINEFITSKKKLRTLIILAPITISLTLISLFIVKDWQTILQKALEVFTNKDSLMIGLNAIKNQINSLTVATLLVPIIIFSNKFKSKTPTIFKDIKWYILILITLNIIISTNHIYGYLYAERGLDLLTRYINISIIFLNLFFLMFIFDKKKIANNTVSNIIILIAIASIVFFNSLTVKHSLNLDLSIFFTTGGASPGSLVSERKFMELFYIPLIIFLLSLTIFEKKKLLATIFIIFNLSIGPYLYYWNIEYSKTHNITRTERAYFSETKDSILMLQAGTHRVVNFIYWHVKVLTENEINVKYFDVYKYRYSEFDFYSQKIKEETNKYNYVLSNVWLKLPLKKSFNTNLRLYYAPEGENLEEHYLILENNGEEFIKNEAQKPIEELQDTDINTENTNELTETSPEDKPTNDIIKAP